MTDTFWRPLVTTRNTKTAELNVTLALDIGLLLGEGFFSKGDFCLSRLHFCGADLLLLNMHKNTCRLSQAYMTGPYPQYGWDFP